MAKCLTAQRCFPSKYFGVECLVFEHLCDDFVFSVCDDFAQIFDGDCCNNAGCVQYIVASGYCLSCDDFHFFVGISVSTP